MWEKMISKDVIEQRVYIYLCLFAFANVLTVAGANVFMGLATAGVLHRVIRYHDDLLDIFQKQQLFWKIVGFLLLAILLSLPGALSPLQGIKFFFNDYIYRLILPLAVLICVHERKKILHIAFCFLMAMFVNDLYVIVQGWMVYPRMNRDSLAGIMPWACLLAMYIPVGIIGLVRSEKAVSKCGWGLFVLASCMASILNETRGAWLAILVTLPIVVFMSLKDKRKFFACIAVAGIFFSVVYQVMPTFQQRMQSIMNPQERSNIERRLAWQSATNMLIEHPLTGVGFAQFQQNYKEHYVLPEAKITNLLHAHNNFFQFLAECGVLGFCAITALCGYLFCFATRGWYKSRRIVYLLLLAVIMGFFLHGLTEYTLRLAVCSKAFWLSIGLCFQWVNLTSNSRPEESPQV
ncbi:O-antigen ligase [Selenomonas ruminantium]|uniref:O-antigen ligase n=2 Tax=Selenomonas ruminantium TaxID=971 RepID=A0A1I0XZL1_SELRU|nr:O-antigen ligase [Selenomonas ruminantium]